MNSCSRRREPLSAFTGMLSAIDRIHCPPSNGMPVRHHRNPQLAAVKPFIGFQTGNLSFDNARTIARADADYVYVDMEQPPMDFYW
jgi:hypothetical protein